MFEWMTDPTAWAGLFALVTLEVVLGVDNLVFIAILSERVEPARRDKARAFGLIMAMGLRLGLLSLASLMLRLTTPLFSVAGLSFSIRDIIFILGGLFLLYKATSELHERLEGLVHSKEGKQNYASFWKVVFQIMVLDAVFSMDAVITAVGMVQHLPVMMLAVIIAVTLMLFAAKPLSIFVNSHPTVVMLCLSFLLLIGLSLVVEGFGVHVPKGYIYAAIGFSVLIEVFNQISTANYRKTQESRPWRERTAEVILRLMGEKDKSLYGTQDEEENEQGSIKPDAESIAGEEYLMISGVLSLGARSLRSLMTPRPEICWINIKDPAEEIRADVLSDQHSHYPICDENLDNILGVARAADILEYLRAHECLDGFISYREPVMAPESVDAIRLIPLMRQSGGSLVLVVDEFGSISGLVTPVDVFEIIAGEFYEEDEGPDIIKNNDGSYLVKGSTDLHHLELTLEVEGLLPPDSDFGTVAGLLLDELGHFPVAGETVTCKDLIFKVKTVSLHRIEEVLVSQEQTQSKVSD